ncbi:hypothetical protein B0F90DRAFT_1822222 [Multifurca ochricompacta]|uniref:Uncharacterized protein n=1 Tax=Multifurca ochricompacta TaxID=376703 RepID=A0AAD4LYR1_9AGAM|nr:hypothetical protein B0F90DRAFT_1822222 [Multifurca ochricompacta]
MSPTPTANTTTTSSSSNFQAIFLAAFKAYKKQTGKDIITHPLAMHIQSCNSPSDIISVLQEQAQQVDQSCARDERLTKWLYLTVNVLYALSATLSEGIVDTGRVWRCFRHLSDGLSNAQ